MKAMRQIAPGEKLTISYGVHCKQHPREIRTEFLNSRLIDCKCDHCNTAVDDTAKGAQQHSMPIECKYCEGLISYDAQPCCRFCEARVNDHKPVKELLYRINEVRNKIRKEGEIEVA